MRIFTFRSSAHYVAVDQLAHRYLVQLDFHWRTPFALVLFQTGFTGLTGLLSLLRVLEPRSRHCTLQASRTPHSESNFAHLAFFAAKIISPLADEYTSMNVIGTPITPFFANASPMYDCGTQNAANYTEYSAAPSNRKVTGISTVFDLWPSLTQEPSRSHI